MRWTPFVGQFSAKLYLDGKLGCDADGSLDRASVYIMST
jgi:hypothetical protein